MTHHRDRLKRMVMMRMHPQLQGRVDASDVIQETFVEAARVLAAGKPAPDLSLHIWLRRLVGQKLIQAHREHLGAQCRATDREVRRASRGEASSYSIARLLIGNHTSPSLAVIRDERLDRLQQALEQMDPVDREVLSLRHFEHLTGPETAEAMGMSHDAVKKRYIRALEKLQRLMVQFGIDPSNPG